MVKEKDFTLPDNVGQFYPGQSPLQAYVLPGFIGLRYNREEWRAIWAKYLGLVKLLDDEVGRLITTLKQEGLYDKAIIIFTVDHGEMLGSHMLWQKMVMYEESAKVPLIVKMPKDFKPLKKEHDEVVSLVDVFPTLLEYNGLPVPTNLDGQSLLPLMQGKPLNRQSIFMQFDGNGSLGSSQRSVVKNNYKLIVDMFKDETFVEVYDVVKDPQEKVNLAFDRNFAPTTNDLLNELTNYMKKTGDRIQLPKNVLADFLKNYSNGDQKPDKSKE
jgi:choline-sulfatase